MSAMATPARIGPPPGAPVIDMKPDPSSRLARYLWRYGIGEVYDRSLSFRSIGKERRQQDSSIADELKLGKL